MHFIKGKANIDLSDTPIENIFIDTYMPTADGNYVKVYLLGYKFACDPEACANFSNEKIARDLNMLLSDVLKAWDYWEKSGIIKKHHLNKDEKDAFTVEFLNLKQLVIDNSYMPITSNGATYQHKNFSPSDLNEALRDEQIRDMFHSIQQLMCRPLSPSESLQYLEWLYDYKMSPGVIEEAFKYSIEKRGIKNINYVNKIITSWYDRNITSIEKLQEHLETTDKKYIDYKKIMKAIGITRNPQEKEKELMNKWLYEYSMPLDVVLKACDTAIMNKPNPTIGYIDGIIKNWFNNDLKSVKEVEANTKTTRSFRRKNNKNKFHNFDQPLLKYTNEQLEELINKKKHV